MIISIAVTNNEDPKPDPQPYALTIDVAALEDAIANTNIGAGTISEPIRIDSFISSYQNKLPEIGHSTTIKARFEPKDLDSDPRNPLICCKVRNMGKSQSHPVDWSTVFDCDPELTYSAPDGTLYINPDKRNMSDVSCHITTLPDKKGAKDDVYISYSILFCSRVGGREYYFNFDPLAKISSNPPSSLK